MPEPATAAEVARAIALGFYAVPRATVDVDVNIFVPPADQLARALTALADVAFVADEEETRLRARANSEGQFRGSIRGLRVDVFVPAFAYYAQLASRRREVTLVGRPLWILSPEDLVVLKMMFFRRKDLADVEAVLRDQKASLDRQFVRRQLIELVGADDERLAALNAIERDVDAL
jgi:hypothetical protein